MLVYSIIMFAAAVLILAVGVSIHRGNTRLIHDYHQKNVGEAERGNYGRAFAKGLFALGAGLLLSGVIALFGERGARASLAALFAGIAVS